MIQTGFGKNSNWNIVDLRACLANILLIVCLNFNCYINIPVEIKGVGKGEENGCL